MQDRCNSIANALELRLSYTNGAGVVFLALTPRYSTHLDALKPNDPHISELDNYCLGSSLFHQAFTWNQWWVTCLSWKIGSKLLWNSNQSANTSPQNAFQNAVVSSVRRQWGKRCNYYKLLSVAEMHRKLFTAEEDTKGIRSPECGIITSVCF